MSVTGNGGNETIAGVAGFSSGAGIAGEPGVAGAPPGTECSSGEHRCHVYQSDGFPVVWQTCQANGRWNEGELCAGHCSPGKNGCATAPSCQGLNTCHFGKNCCNSLPLPGGSFDRSQLLDSYGDDLCTEDEPCPATVSPFLLDAFEVTVGRFRNFVRAYSREMTTPGSGRNPNNGQDPGWDKAWNEFLPKDAAELRQRLLPSSCTGANYTEDPSENEYQPINCVDWFLSQAFCIWDGGRLPTETEWDYVASGGKRRLYPWSDPPSANHISQEYAVYSDKTHQWTSPQDVGTAALGVSRWGQFDLAGNLFEWLLDASSDTYVDLEQCRDCANFGWNGTWLRSVRGGCYATDSSVAAVSYRTARTADLPWNWAGFRCARDL